MSSTENTQSRSEALRSVRTVVVKLGTQLLSEAGGRIDLAFLQSIARQAIGLLDQGVKLTIVSSGAIGCGMAELGLTARPTDLGKLQAVAAIGQRRLMDAWADAFGQTPVAQILLTREDIDDRRRFLNLRNTIAAVHELGGVPIVNENDTVSTAELVKITFGDNDILGALVAHALRADLLVLLTVVDGLQREGGNPLRRVEDLDGVLQHVRAEKSPRGKGGMESKLSAARMLMDAGEAMIVAHGRDAEILPRLLAGEELGTLFQASGAKKRSARSRWIGAVSPAGTITVDAGAKRALAEQNRSLLPAGIVKASGAFERGDVVRIEDEAGVAIARGLSNYSADDLQRIRGKKTAAVRELLAEAAYDEAVHRDNLVLE